MYDVLPTFCSASSVVMEIVDEAFYRIGTKNGVLSQLFSREQIAACTTTFLNLNDVHATSVTVREVNVKSSVTGGQGFFQCACLTKCLSNRCACRKKMFCVIQGVTIPYRVATSKSPSGI